MEDGQSKTVTIPTWAWSAITLVSRTTVVALCAVAFQMWNDIRDINTWRQRELIIQQEAQATQFQTQIDSVEERARMNSNMLQMLIIELNNVQVQLARLEGRIDD